MGSMNWKDIPVEGGKCDIYQYSEGFVIAYFFPDDGKTHEEIIISDRSFYPETTNTENGEFYIGARELKKRIPELQDSDVLPDYIKEMLLLKDFQEFEDIEVMGGVYNVNVFETGDVNRFVIIFSPIPGVQEVLLFNGRFSFEKVHGASYEGADRLRKNLPELLDSDELTGDVKKALSIIEQG